MHPVKPAPLDTQDLQPEISESPTKTKMLDFISEAFDLIKDNLDPHEKRGHYLFHVMKCRQHLYPEGGDYFGINTEEHKMMGP